MMSNQRSVVERYIGSTPVGRVGHGVREKPLWLAVESSLSALDGLRISPWKIVYDIVPYNDVRCWYLLCSNLFILL